MQIMVGEGRRRGGKNDTPNSQETGRGSGDDPSGPLRPGDPAPVGHRGGSQTRPSGDRDRDDARAGQRGNRPDRVEGSPPCKITYGPNFEASVDILAPTYVLKQAVDDFFMFKATNGPDSHFGTVDKSSGVNHRGEVIRVYADNNIWHAHLTEAGDPLLVYQKTGPNSITIIRVSTHREHFGGNKSRSQFVALDPGLALTTQRPFTETDRWSKPTLVDI